MHKTRGLQLVATLFCCAILFSSHGVRAQDASDTALFALHSHFMRLQQSFVARIECDDNQGTAFIAQLPEVPDVVFAVTNRHLVQDADSASIRIPLGKEVGIDTVIEVRTALEIHPVGSTVGIRTGVAIIWPEDDIAVILIRYSNILDRIRGFDVGMRYLTPDEFTRWDDLLPGQSVTFIGFPLGISTGGRFPLVRRGMIAGVDAIQDVVLIDGQFFDGSSGSPVFLDRRDPSCMLPYRSERWLVGIVSGYRMFKRPLMNPKTGQTEVIMSENSGLGYVIPSAKLHQMLTSIVKVHAK